MKPLTDYAVYKENNQQWTFKETNATDARGLIEITNNVLKAIIKCRKQILSEMELLLNY